MKARVEKTVAALDTAFGGRSQWDFHTGCEALLGVCNNAMYGVTPMVYLSMLHILKDSFVADADAYGVELDRKSLVVDEDLIVQAKEVLWEYSPTR